MAKNRNKISNTTWAIVVLFVLIVLSNIYWMVVVNNLRTSNDSNGETAYNALIKSTALETCYKDSQKVCSVPAYQHFSMPKGY